MDLTLDDAIKHCEEVARQNEEDAIVYSNCKNNKKNLYEIGLAENAEKKCSKCAAEHRQLAEWLKDYKRLLEQESALDKIKIEIADIYCGQYCENSLTPYAVRETALEIIDKYRAERIGE